MAHTLPASDRDSVPVPALDSLQVRIACEREVGPCELQECEIEQFGGEGFMGLHLCVRARVSLSDGSCRELRFFAKERPRGQKADLVYLNGTGAYIKEAGVYTLMKDGLQRPNRPQIAPRAMLLREDLIILEDARVLGFQPVTNWLGGLDEGLLETVLEALAELHSASISYEALSGRSLWDSNKSVLYEIFYSKGGPREEANYIGWKWVLAGFDTVLDLVPDALGVTADAPEAVAARQSLTALMERLPGDLGTPSDKYRNVLTHGDMWASNILVRDEPRQVMLVDFQLARYAPPAHDLSVFLHMCATPDVRRTQSHRLLQHYHAAFSSALARDGISVDDVCSLQELFRSYRDFQAVACLQRCMYMPAIALPESVRLSSLQSPSELMNLMIGDRRPLMRQTMKTHPEYREKVVDCVKELLTECFMTKDDKNDFH